MHLIGYTLQISCCKSLSADPLLPPTPPTTCIHAYFCGKLALIYKSFDCRILFAIGRASCERRNFYANKQLTGSCKAANLDFRPQPATVAAAEAEATAAWAARAAKRSCNAGWATFCGRNFCHIFIECSCRNYATPILPTLPRSAPLWVQLFVWGKQKVCLPSTTEAKRSRCERFEKLP